MTTPTPERLEEIGTAPLRNFVTLGAGELLSRLIAFAGTVYLARQLGVEMYGVVGLGVAILMYTSILADCGLEYTGPREVVETRTDLSTLLWSSLIARSGASVLSALLQFVIALAFFEGAERAVVALYALALLPVGLSSRWAHIGLGRATIVSVARLAAETTKLAVIVVFVRGPESVLAVPIGYVAGEGIAALLLLAVLRRRGLRRPATFESALAVAMVRRALPMTASAILAMVIFNSDLFFLRAFRDSTEVGRYVAAYTLLGFFGILGHMIALSLTPALARVSSSSDRAVLVRKGLGAAVTLGLPIAAGATLTAPLVIDLLFGPAYEPSAIVLMILIWCMPLLLYRSVMQAALVSSNRTRDVLRTTMIAAIVNVVLNCALVPLFGMLGAAFTTVGAEAVRAGVARRYVRSEGVAMPPASLYGRGVISALVMVAVLLAIRPAALWTAVAIGVGTYAAVLTLTGGLRIHRGGIRLSF